jgi:iron complex outermembrane receptor protein
MKRLLLILFICLLKAFPANSQILKDTVKLKEVFVTSAKQITEKGFYLKNIDSIALANTSNTGISELLHKNSSLYIKTYGAGGMATASFRGTSASHTQVLWNGLNINSPLWGQTDLSLLPVFFTDEVSLFYGSSSLAKTSGGLGGCINLNNTPQWNAGPAVSFSQTAGSFGYFLSQLKAGYSKNKFISNTRVFWEKAENNFKFFNNGNEQMSYMRQINADYQKAGFLQEFYYKINASQFAGIRVMSIWNDRSLPPIMNNLTTNINNPNKQEQNQQDKLVNITGDWKYYRNKSNLTVSSGYIRNSLDYFLSNSNPGETLVNYDTKSVSNVIVNKINFQYNSSEKTVFKISSDAQYISANYSDSISELKTDRTDVSAQASVHHVFNSQLSGYILSQQKLMDGDFMPLIAAAGMEFQQTRNITLRTNFGRNLHVPTLNDMYFNPGGNKNLKPETGYQGDAGIQWNFRNGNINYQLEATGFSAWIENWILWRPSEYRYWTANNVQQVFSRGAELNASIKGDFLSVHYILKANYSYTRTTDEEKSSPSYDMQLIYIPKHIGNIHLCLEKNKYSAIISWHYTGPRYASTVENGDHLVQSYYLLDAGIGKTFKLKSHSFDINFKLNNILNEQYQVIKYRAMPGRNFSLTLSYRLNS